MGNMLYFCVDADSRRKYEQLGMGPFSYSMKKGRVQVRKYCAVPAELFEDQEKLVEWAH
jgi:DNA transformation protein